MSQMNIPDLFKKYYTNERNKEAVTEAEAEAEEASKRKRESKEGEGTEPNEGEKDTESASSGSSKRRKGDPTSIRDKVKKAVIYPEDSDSEESEGGWETVKAEGKIVFPERDPNLLLNNKFPTLYLASRFNLVIKHMLPVSQEKQMIKTMVTINAVLEQIKEEAEKLFKWKGSPAILPWQDEDAYANRLMEKFLYAEFHDKKDFKGKKAQIYLKEYVHKWGFLPRSATVKEHGEATKYFQIQLAWLFDEAQFVVPSRRLWISTVLSATENIEGASVRLSNTQAKNPVTAIQFLNSAVNISGNWDDMGHADCTYDLKIMIAKLLGDDIEIGISSRKFDGGKYNDKTPNVMTVECDQKDVQRVQKELVSIFSKMESEKNDGKGKTKRDRILQGIWTNWVAVPTMSSIASRSDISKRAIYSQMELQEKAYRSNLLSYKVQGVRIDNLDKVAPEEYHLSAEVLLQLENEIIDKGDSPIRHLIYDATFEEMKKEMIQGQIPVSATEDEVKKMIKDLKEKIQWKEVMDALEKKGVKVPHACLPVSRPSKLSLRAKLLGLKSRKHPEENILVFESVTLTNDGDLLLTFKSHCSEEAQVIGELLPLFIKHEMEIDPIYYCMPELLQKAQEGYYNPLVRTGYSGLMKNVFDNGGGPSKKAVLPEFCSKLSAAELVKVLKCPGFSTLPLVADLGDDDLASLANTIATSPNPRPLPEGGILSLERMLRESKLIETSTRQDELSDMSGSSFDSAASFTRFQIQERAKLLAKQMQKRETMEKLIEASRSNTLEKLEVETYAKIGGFTIKEFYEHFPNEAKIICPEVLETSTSKGDTIEQTMWSSESGNDEQEDDDESMDDDESTNSDESGSDEQEDDDESMNDDESTNSDDTEKRAGSPQKGAGTLNPGNLS